MGCYFDDKKRMMMRAVLCFIILGMHGIFSKNMILQNVCQISKKCMYDTCAKVLKKLYLLICILHCICIKDMYVTNGEIR